MPTQELPCAGCWQSAQVCSSSRAARQRGKRLVAPLDERVRPAEAGADDDEPVAEMWVAGTFGAELPGDAGERCRQLLLLNSQASNVRGAGAGRRVAAEENLQQQLIARRLGQGRLGQPRTQLR